MVWLPALSKTFSRATVICSEALPVIRPETVELASKLFMLTVPLAFVELAVKKRLVLALPVQVPFKKKYFYRKDPSSLVVLIWRICPFLTLKSIYLLT